MSGMLEGKVAIVTGGAKGLGHGNLYMRLSAVGAKNFRDDGKFEG